METSSIDLGGVRITRIVEASDPLLRPAEIFPDSTPEILRANHDWLVPRFYDVASDRLVITIQSFLLQAGGRNIVVDTCVGDCKPRVRQDFDGKRWNWLERLEAAGVNPQDVDVAVSTHLHVDHVGWHTRLVDGEWRPTFPNARYLFTHPEWEYWRDNEGHPALARSGDYIGDSVWPLFHAGQADLVAMDHELLPGITLVPLPGHTPGHVGVAVRGDSRQALLTADLFHHPLQCCYPEWNTRFCLDQERSRATRMGAMAKLADEGTLLMPSHFPGPNAGVLRRLRPGEDPAHPDHVYRFEFEN
jgi:glyoxylase-like metal-dependent hydrolase (beta-lactamase superfamily II)